MQQRTASTRSFLRGAPSDLEESITGDLPVLPPFRSLIRLLTAQEEDIS